MCTSHSVMEGQRHNNPLTDVAFVYNGPKGMELAPNLTHAIVEVAKALGGLFVCLLAWGLTAISAQIGYIAP